jgi:hypothetical protein
MKTDQIAYYCSNSRSEEFLKRSLGLADKEWIRDTVTGMSSVWGGQPQKNIGELQFNYDLGIEVEILRYTSGPFWHESVNFSSEPFISHVGAHLEDGEEFPAFAGCRLAQETFTVSHTSEYLTTGAAAGRLYHYKIFELRRGNYFKLIKRIHPPIKE